MTRLLTAAAGILMFCAGVYLGGLGGLLLMMAGLAPAITGIANISLAGEIREEREHRRAQQRGLTVPRDGTSIASHR